MDFSIVSDPLFPIASRSLRRATLAAEAMGLVAVPYTYVVQVGATQVGGNAVSLQLDVPASQGPLVVTEIIPPPGRGAASMVLRTGGAYLTDGYVRVGDALTLPRSYMGRLPSSPQCISAGDNLTVVLDDPTGAAWTAAEGIRVNGIGVRKPVRGSRMLGPATDDEGAAWLKAVASDGVWWGTTVSGTGSTRYASVDGDVVVECVILAIRNALIEGEVVPDDVQVRVGDHLLTPQGGPLANLGLVISGETVVLLPGLRWPVPSSTRVQLLLHYPAGATPLPVRATLLGRRGGVAGGCW